MRFLLKKTIYQSKNNEIAFKWKVLIVKIEISLLFFFSNILAEFNPHALH